MTTKNYSWVGIQIGLALFLTNTRAPIDYAAKCSEWDPCPHQLPVKVSRQIPQARTKYNNSEPKKYGRLRLKWSACNWNTIGERGRWSWALNGITGWSWRMRLRPSLAAKEEHLWKHPDSLPASHHLLNDEWCQHGDQWHALGESYRFGCAQICPHYQSAQDVRSDHSRERGENQDNLSVSRKYWYLLHTKFWTILLNSRPFYFI